MNVLARESLPAWALPQHQHQLLERELATAGVNAGDGPRMTARDVAQVMERLLRPQGDIHLCQGLSFNIEEADIRVAAESILRTVGIGEAGWRDGKE